MVRRIKTRIRKHEMTNFEISKWHATVSTMNIIWKSMLDFYTGLYNNISRGIYLHGNSLRRNNWEENIACPYWNIWSSYYDTVPKVNIVVKGVNTSITCAIDTFLAH
jgi:hypothetical protein